MTTYFEYMAQKTEPRRIGKTPELAADFVEFAPVHEFGEVFASNTGITVRPMTPEELDEWAEDLQRLQL